jgi:aminopeptidase YwaD
MKKSVWVALPFLVLVSCNIGRNTPDITDKELAKNIGYLASRELKGRLAGSEGGQKASQYIRKKFSSAGLRLLKDDGYQTFPIVYETEPGGGNILSFSGSTFVPGQDYLPLEFSTEDTLEATVCFAGYGIDIDKEGQPWHDYNGMDVAGKWILVLRGSPEWDNTPLTAGEPSDDIYKCLVAREKGASGVLLVSGPSYSQDDKIELSGMKQRSAGLPVILVSRKLADSLLFSSGKTIAGLEAEITKVRHPLSFPTDVFVKGITDLETKKAEAWNVIALLEGSDSVLKDEYIVIGAHYDHLGMGGKGSPSRKPDTLAVHFGADDNASGISAMLEMAGKFAAEKPHTRRSLLFVAFDAEEMGTLGSRAFVNDPPVELNKLKTMINLDMVGRLNAGKSLQVSGTGTSIEGDSILKVLASAYDLSLATTPEGYGPSDHASFYSKDIPVFFFTTGPHLEYHTPADAPSTINIAGLHEVTTLAMDLAWKLDTLRKHLTFKEAGPKSSTGYSLRRNGITLGIMPDFAGIVKDGLRADFVIPGRPAALGGMKDNDIIVNVNGTPVKNIDDYMFCLSKLKAGETIHVEVIREKEKMVLIIQL